MSKFQIEQHQKIIKILDNFNSKFLADCGAYFGGGTYVSLSNNEHRLSKDIDFICSFDEGYRLLRQEISNKGYDCLFKPNHDLSLPGSIKTDRYGIRFLVVVDSIPIKCEIVAEGRISLDLPEQPNWLPVRCLNQTDLFAEKLLANADRWLDRSVSSRDLIDLAILRLNNPISERAIEKAERAYSTIDELRRAVIDFQTDRDYRENCYETLQVNSPNRIIDGIDLLAGDFELEPTERAFLECNWDYLDYVESDGRRFFNNL